MPFIFYYNGDIVFIDYKYIEKLYMTANILLIIWLLKMICRKKYAKMVFNKNIEAFIVYLFFPR